MGQVNLPILEVDYYNCMWNKRVLSPQAKAQTGNNTVPGGTGVSARYGVWPLNIVYAPPLNIDVVPFPSPVNDRNASVVKENFYIEEMFLRGGFNDASMSYGVRAYLDEDEPLQQHRFNTLIYSGIYNSRTGINRTNEFPIGTNITRSANPQYASIQKIYAEENNLIVLQENKCSRALIDKSAIYNAEGGGNVTTTNQVLGEIVPYTGEYGISKNPESFAIYAFRKYFVDRNRNAVLRLSHDGITEISEYGMRDYFRDKFKELTDDYNYIRTVIPIVGSSSNSANFNQNLIGYSTATPGGIGNTIQYGTIGSKILVEYNNSGSYVDLNIFFVGVQSFSNSSFIVVSRTLTPDEQNSITSIQLLTYNRSRIYGGWDGYNKQYVLSLQPNETSTYVQSGTQVIPKFSSNYATLGYDEQVQGWPSFYSFKPTQIGSLKSNFYSVNSDWYSVSPSKVYTPIKLGLYKHYSTSVPHSQFYSIDNGCEVSIIANSQPSVQKNFLTIDYEGFNGWEATILASDRTGFDAKRSTAGVWTGDWVARRDQGKKIHSYLEGAYDSLNNTGLAANPINQPIFYAGFNRKENKYVANIVNDTPIASGEIISGNKMSGIKGFYMDVTFTTDTTTDPGGMKELYSIGLNYNVSSM